VILASGQNCSPSDQNRCSRCARISVHHRPEWVFMISQNMQSYRLNQLSLLNRQSLSMFAIICKWWTFGN